MFEISQLKAKTLVELQEIAKTIGLTKFSQLKKLDLVYQILDTQAANPAPPQKTTPSEKPKRKRVAKRPTVKKAEIEKKTIVIKIKRFFILKFRLV